MSRSETKIALSWKRQLFVAYYLVYSLNGAKAARAAGYKASNARFYASRLLSRPDVRQHLADKTRAMFDRLNARGT
jgi:phage terminase small subunit